ncbi:MAG: cysteine hydrolase family protein [Candidatus Zixiibacteriota bacterium]
MKAYTTSKSIKSQAKGWLKTIAPFNEHNLKLNAEKAALLVVDMQNFFLEPDSPTYTCGGPAVLPYIAELVAAFRRAGRPVIFTRHVHDPEGIDAGIMKWWWQEMCVEGTLGSEIHPDLTPLAHERIVNKHRYSAFYNTDLETVLRGMGIEDLVISGIMTNMCCESTARDAYFRDYRVFFPADGTGSVNEEMHLASLLNLAFGFACVTTVDELIKQTTASVTAR